MLIGHVSCGWYQPFGTDRCLRIMDHTGYAGSSVVKDVHGNEEPRGKFREAMD